MISSVHAYLVSCVGIALIRYFLIGLCTHICHTVYLVIVSLVTCVMHVNWFTRKYIFMPLFVKMILTMQYKQILLDYMCLCLSFYFILFHFTLI